LEYLTPMSLDDALAALDAGELSIIAGGTDWYPAQGECPIECDILDVTRIAALRGISKAKDGWRIGAASTWSDVIAADLPAAFDGLKAAARDVGSVQIQNAGTIAGNLCNASPAADGVPPLLALKALVEICSAEGCRGHLHYWRATRGFGQGRNGDCGDNPRNLGSAQKCFREIGRAQISGNFHRYGCGDMRVARRRLE
jgi:CO/xanthine dehydrogenase FAD-binding subunit